jgi:single-strand selective monofunctional uracil DNA glycosylase
VTGSEVTPKAGKVIEIYRELSEVLGGQKFGPPVTHVYNPLEYARDPAEQYLRLASSGQNRVVLLGMNPGPWGMAQTGVPFGTVNMVRDWLRIEGRVGKPKAENPKRPITGFEVKREEVSGTRFWGWARDRFSTPEKFFDQFFVANYCPLVFMEASGKNRTPDKLPASEKAELFGNCDEALRKLIGVLKPEQVIGIGKFAEDRAKAAVNDPEVRTGRVLHPSPASPIANRGWAGQAEKQLEGLGIVLP